MRLRTMIITVLTLAGLAGCGLFDRDEKKEEIERLLQENAQFSVFLKDGVTAPQKAGIEARLRQLPDLKDVVFEDHDAAYAKMKKLFADEPENLPNISPDDLPESFVTKMNDQEAVRNVRDTPLQAELKSLPGVQDLVFSCTTLDECEELYKKRATPSPAVT